jgi:hypothetical protein
MNTRVHGVMLLRIYCKVAHLELLHKFSASSSAKEHMQSRSCCYIKSCATRRRHVHCLLEPMRRRASASATFLPTPPNPSVIVPGVELPIVSLPPLSGLPITSLIAAPTTATLPYIQWSTTASLSLPLLLSLSHSMSVSVPSEAVSMSVPVSVSVSASELVSVSELLHIGCGCRPARALAMSAPICSVSAAKI